MKLKNKKTGEIVDFMIHKYAELSDDGNPVYAQFNGSIEEWEDYEELKDWWQIDRYGNIYRGNPEVSEYLLEQMKQIGNYFNTKEEAEIAVRKLKAWKRLKDKGFKFDKWNVHDNGKGITIFANYPSVTKAYLDLLFGGENEIFNTQSFRV